MRILRAADRVAVPWKNGGGVTREVAVWPPGSGFDTFDWRISMAEVNTDGPFSDFPLTDRILAVLEGTLGLTIGGEAYQLTAGDPPLSFPGDVPASGALPDGPVLDLNLMSRRGRARARLDVVELHGSTVLAPRVTTLVLCDGEVILDEVVQLSRYDALVFEGGEQAVELRAAAAQRIYVASFEAV